MKIAYLFHRDAANSGVQSGRPASILAEFERLGHEVQRVFPLAAQPAKASLSKKIAYRLLGRHYRADREPEYLQAAAAEFRARTEGESYDLVFSPGSEMVSHLQTDQPIAFCADATFANMVDYYWDFTNLSEEYLRKGHAQEAASLARASLAVYPSEWAARSAIKDYGADPAKVAVIPFGANLGKNNARHEVARWIEWRPRQHLRLLFVGRDWERKGGELVVATAYCLIKLGHQVTVSVVGCDLPNRYRGLPWLVSYGPLNPRVPLELIQLHELYAQAHFVFVPSRAEAYGMTFAEANAFGVPAVATATGGIPAVVRDGHNGLLLPIDATASAYADAIADTFASHDRYRQLCHRAFDTFEQRLNWRVFCRRFLELAEARCLRPAETAAPAACPVP